MSDVRVMSACPAVETSQNLVQPPECTDQLPCCPEACSYDQQGELGTVVPHPVPDHSEETESGPVRTDIVARARLLLWPGESKQAQNECPGTSSPNQRRGSGSGPLSVNCPPHSYLPGRGAQQRGQSPAKYGGVPIRETGLRPACHIPPGRSPRNMTRP